MVTAPLVPCWVATVTLSLFRLVSADAGAVVKKEGRERRKVSLLLKASRGQILDLVSYQPGPEPDDDQIHFNRFF